MENRQTVQFALMCLEAIDRQSPQAIPLQDLSHCQGVPLPECLRVLRRLSDAGIIELQEAGYVRLCRPVEELTALEILQALWAPEEKQTTFRLLVGGKNTAALRTTLQFVRQDQRNGKDSSLNG